MENARQVGMTPITVTAEAKWQRCRSALWQRQHPDNYLDVHPHDGRGGIEARERGCNPKCELHGETARSPIFPSFSKANAARCARVHRGSSPVEKRRHRGEDVAKRLMDYGFHAPTVFLAGRWDDDDRTDRERAKNTSSIVLRRNDLNPQEIGAIAKGKMDRENNMLKTRRTPRGKSRLMNGTTLTRANKQLFPRRDARTQVLARRRPHRQRLWRSESLLLRRQSRNSNPDSVDAAKRPVSKLRSVTLLVQVQERLPQSESCYGLEYFCFDMMPLGFGDRID